MQCAFGFATAVAARIARRSAVRSFNSLLKKVFEVSLWATLIQDPSARRTKDSQPSGFGFEYCASHVRFRVFQQTVRTRGGVPGGIRTCDLRIRNPSS